MQPDLVFDDMRDLPDLLAASAAAESLQAAGKLLCAVDVGTGSARAGIFDGQRQAARPRRPSDRHEPAEARPRRARFRGHLARRLPSPCAARSPMPAPTPADIAGISFDATCSLVVRDRDGAQLGVSTGGGERWDTIVWLDHRALDEADACTATGHQVLDYLGGVMSPEMQTPKLMWIKRNLPEVWERAGQFFDLTDFLTYRASGSNARSQCTLACKWTYLAHEEAGWQRDFFEAVGVPDMLSRGDLPERASLVGTDLGPLTAEAAAALGLTTQLPGRRRADRRLCRRAGRACRLHRRSLDDRPPPRADCRDVELRHGDVDRAAPVRRRLGAVFRRRACRTCGCARAASRRPARCSTI